MFENTPLLGPKGRYTPTRLIIEAVLGRNTADQADVGTVAAGTAQPKRKMRRTSSSRGRTTRTTAMRTPIRRQGSTPEITAA